MSKVGLKKGTNRRETVRAALELVRDEVGAKVDSTVLLKPNFLSSTNQLAATNPDAIRGVIDFLMSLPNAPKEVWVAEGGNEKESGDAFRNFGYHALDEEYAIPVRLIDLNQETEWVETEIELANGDKWLAGMPKTVLDCPTTISVAVAKTHDVLYTTLALKNMIMGTLRKVDRVKMHGYMTHGERERPRECQMLNRNLIRVAEYLTPDIAVVDGVEGLQGNGPGGTDVVPLGAAFAGANVWSTDAICTQAMGFDPNDLGVFVYAQERGMGDTDPSRITVVGDRVQDVRRTFKPHDWFPHQQAWRDAAAAF